MGRESTQSLALNLSPSKQSQKFPRRYMQPFLMLPISNQISKLPSFGSMGNPRLKVKGNSVCTGSPCDCAPGPLYPHFWSSFWQSHLLFSFSQPSPRSGQAPVQAPLPGGSPRQAEAFLITLSYGHSSLHCSLSHSTAGFSDLPFFPTRLWSSSLSL